jgi:hypothetical protein
MSRHEKPGRKTGLIANIFQESPMGTLSGKSALASVHFVTLEPTPLLGCVMTTVWIYVDPNKDVGDPDHLKVFATPEAADEWFKDNDPEGVVFGYIGDEAAPRS